MKTNQKMITAAGVAGGAVLMGLGAYAIWNSRDFRMMRVAKRAGRILYQTGSALQSISNVAEDVLY